MSTLKPIERFDPELMSGQLLEAEHLARYHWAAALVEGKRVLDAGCGTGYGTELLARGASSVVGVDIDEGTVEAASKGASGKTTFEKADLLELSDRLGDFDVVVCFEVLEHLEEPEKALDQLARVLRGDGVLVVSSPNRNVYPPGNPYHVHEFTPDELAAALSGRFANVRLVRQQDWLATALFEDEDFARLEDRQVAVAKTSPGEPGQELYSIGLAGNSALPPTPPLVMLTQTADLKWWQELLQQVRDELAAKVRHVQDLEGWLKESQTELGETQRELEAMQDTRVWRLGMRYWALRDRILGRSKPRS